MPAFELDPDVPLQVTFPKAMAGGGLSVPSLPSYSRTLQQCWGLRNPMESVHQLEPGLLSASHAPFPSHHSPTPHPQASLVHTTETTRIRYFMDLLMGKAWPVMLVGNAGTGKSVLMGDKLESLGTDDYLVQAVPFNFYTTSAMLQGRRAWLHPHISAQPHSLSPPPTVGLGTSGLLVLSPWRRLSGVLGRRCSGGH